jgi:hypothetical protein
MYQTQCLEISGAPRDFLKSSKHAYDAIFLNKIVVETRIQKMQPRRQAWVAPWAVGTFWARPCT